MTSVISKAMFWLWPPYEARIAGKIIDRRTDISDWSRMEDVQQRIRRGLDSDTELDELKAMAKLVFESENKRKETLESKALTFVSAFGLSITVVSGSILNLV